MSLLTVSLLIDSLIPLVNSPALVKNEKKPFVLVQTRRIRMDVQAAGGGGAGQAAPSHWSEGYEDWPRPLGGVGRERGVRQAGVQFSVCACVSAVLYA